MTTTNSDTTANTIADSSSPFELLHFATGKPSPYGTFPNQIQGNQVQITPGGILILMHVDDPTPREIEQVGGRRFEVRLLRGEHALMFLFRFGEGLWQEAPYAVHRVDEAYREFPPDPPDGMAWFCTIALVDAKSGMVSTLRRLTISTTFSRAVLKAIEKQKQSPAEDAAHQREVLRWQTRSTGYLAGQAIDRYAQDTSRRGN